MNDQLFKGPKLKVQRAKKHISDLHNEIVAYMRRKPYRIVVEQDTEPQRCVLVIRVREEVPDNLATIIGDAVHNLRTALDILACELVRINSGDPEGVYFPFCREGKDFENTIKHRNIDRASPEVVNIIRTLKPYTGGNHLLRAVHDLDLSDKHRDIIPCAFYTGIPNITFHEGDKAIGGIINCRVGPIKDGIRPVSLPITQNIKLGQYFTPAIDITFGEKTPFHREPVIPTLHQLTEVVDGIVDTFEAHFLRADS